MNIVGSAARYGARVPGALARPAGRLSYRLSARLCGEAYYHVMRLATARVKVIVEGRDHLEAARASGQNLIFVGWHQAFSLHMAAYDDILDRPGCTIVMMDWRGRTLAQALRHMKHRVVPVSPAGYSSAVARGTLRLLSLIRRGYYGLVAVDGPWGPRHVVKPGAFYLAQKADALLVPVGADARPQLVLAPRWDRHQVPLPYSTVAITIGEPFTVPPEGDEAQPYLAEQLRDTLQALTAAARERLHP